MYLRAAAFAIWVGSVCGCTLSLPDNPKSILDGSVPDSGDALDVSGDAVDGGTDGGNGNPPILYAYDLLRSKLVWLDAETGQYGGDVIDMPTQTTDMAYDAAGEQLLILGSDLTLSIVDPCTGAIDSGSLRMADSGQTLVAVAGIARLTDGRVVIGFSLTTDVGRLGVVALTTRHITPRAILGGGQYDKIASLTSRGDDVYVTQDEASGNPLDGFRIGSVFAVPITGEQTVFPSTVLSTTQSGGIHDFTAVGLTGNAFVGVNPDSPDVNGSDPGGLFTIDIDSGVVANLQEGQEYSGIAWAPEGCLP